MTGQKRDTGRVATLDGEDCEIDDLLQPFPDRPRGEEGTGDLGEDHGDVAVRLIVCRLTSKLALTRPPPS